MNWYPRHVGDYLRSAAHLSLLEHGVLTRLLDLYYVREAPIPAEDIARLICARSPDEIAALETVLREFFTVEDGQYRQHRCDRELARFKEKQAKAAESARTRWDRQRSRPGHANANADAMPTESNGIADGMRTHSEGSATQKPEARSHVEPPHPPEGGAFDEFWALWPTHPRKVDKEGCRRKWRTKNCDAIAETVLGALRAAIESDAWRKDGGAFIPSPRVWLNQSRWDAPTEAEVESALWRDTRSGIEAKGESLGLGRWDEDAFNHGRGEPFPVYEARVLRAAGESPRCAA